MKYTGPIYRPPIEANSLLLQVTVGCTHNKCNFCTMYKDVPFQMETLKQVENDLIEASQSAQTYKRVFLLNADPFALSADKLSDICKLIHHYLPDVEVITMYAAIRNIKSKSDDELQLLMSLGIKELWVGLETGEGAALKRMNKGHDLKDACEQLKRLNRAGIKHNDMYILGALGSRTARKAALATAELINATKPNLIGVATLGLFPGSGLSKMASDGLFVPASEREVLEELKHLVGYIETDEMMLYADHNSNTAGLRGLLPRDNQHIIHQINSILDIEDDILDSHINRYSM